MLKSLKYRVRFAATGRVLENTMSFEQGLTAITGPNEAGKSFVIEMLRYALFGTAALRGVAGDYAELQATLCFKDYELARNPRGATIKQNGEPIATGTRAVNQKVLDILRFGLDVFDVSVVCNQGDVERLGAMTPSDRKRMVDRVIGVDRIEELQKWVDDQRLLVQRAKDTLSRDLSQPVMPECPEGYRPSETIKQRLEVVSGLAAEASELRGWLASTRQEPLLPTNPGGDLDVLAGELDRSNRVASELAELGRLTVVQSAQQALLEAWAAHDLWEAKVAFLRRYPAPTISQEEADGLSSRLLQQQELGSLERQLAMIEKGQQITCPSCGTEFYLDHKKHAQVIARLHEVKEILGPDTKPVDEPWLATQKALIKAYQEPEIAAQWLHLKDAIERPRPVEPRWIDGRTITQAEFNTRQSALAVTRAPAEILKEIVSNRAYDEAVLRYAADRKIYDDWLAQWKIKQERLQIIDREASEVSDISLLYNRILVYETQLTRYQRDIQEFEKTCNLIDEMQSEIDGWRACREALVDLRMRIKTYLVPSLSKVASHLLTQMTDGQRTSIVVDENFDVAVDGQRLDTLSGSGKACANLALRIGLGQVLTNNVLSLFIGDEIDASMDASRAATTHSSIRALSSSISQILLITHKIPVADHVVSLGVGDERAIYS
jgi:DNA repair exonuclease SbcCD ATPase subunit